MVGARAQTRLTQPGPVAGRYEYVRELGAGDSGRVWLVNDCLAGGVARALKWVQPEAAERVHCELALLSRIVHPNLARVYELVRGPAPGALGLISDYAPGEPVDRAARKLATRREELLTFALRVLHATASALAALHDHGFVHGDVKPEHGLVSPDAARLHVIDLGLARPPGLESQVSGTPHYMAPESWRGEVAPAGDIYALGVTVRELLAPADPPLTAAEPELYFARSLQPRAALPSWVPAPLAGLLERMCAVDRAARIATGAELVDALADLGAALGGKLGRELGASATQQRKARARASALTALPLIGRQGAFAALREALEREPLIAVVGARESGRSRVVRDAVFAWQAACSARGDAIASYRVVTRLPELPESGASVLHVLDADTAEASEVQAWLRAAELIGGPQRVVLECTALPAGFAGLSIALPLLAAADVQALLRAALPGESVREPLVREALAVSGGLAARLCRVLIAARLAGAELSDPSVLRAHAARAEGEVRVPERALPLARLLAVSGGSLSHAAAVSCGSELAIAEAARALCALGLCTRGEGGRLRLRPDVQLGLWRQLTAAERAELARGLRALPEEAWDGRERAFLALASGEPAAAASELAALAEQLLGAGDPAAAHALLVEARELFEELPAQLALCDAEALRALGRYPRALATLEPIVAASGELELDAIGIGRSNGAGVSRAASQLGAFASSGLARTARSPAEEARSVLSGAAQQARGIAERGLLLRRDVPGADDGAAEPSRPDDAARARMSPAVVERAVVLLAEVSRLSGDAVRARAIAEQVLARVSAGARAACHALLGRVALDAGDWTRCRAHAREAARLEDEPAALRASELLALADLSEGELARARVHADAGIAAARHQGARAAEARLCAVLGSIERAEGAPLAAARSFGRAFELARAHGEYHAAASFSVNLATAQLDAGELGPALRNLRRGASALARLGRERDSARVLTNLALAAQLMGDFASALAAGEQAQAFAARAGDAFASAVALLSCAEVALERGDSAGARARLEALPELSGLAPVDRAVALARAAALWVGLREEAAALQQLTAAEALLPSAPAAAAECALARCALVRARGEHAAALEHAERAVAEAKARGELAVSVLSLAAAAHAAEASGQVALAHARFSELRALLDAAALTLTAAERAQLRGVRAYRAALAALPAAAPGTREQVDQRFRQLTWHVKRLTGETRLSRLYDAILEAAIELSGAESGVLLRRVAERVRPCAVFGPAGTEALAGAQWSQSIVTRVLASGQPLSTVDAAQDASLAAASSVHALSLRSVLALPIRVQDAVSGVIYLEDRLRPFAFGEAELAVLSDFSALAALAITGVERLRRERRAVRRLSLAQERLARQLELQAQELEAWKQTQAPGDPSEQTGIVAQSGAMREVLGLALRVASSDVPVLIRGESGTGKELVARAIHAHSPRNKRPFVSESCAAIPEALLESALFGHVKGAFTGADRRRVGMFEAADGGTLLLDEIGEMSPSMQTRLLRVLQEGEIRPLGGERTVRVDVRVLAATHRDLDAMVIAGTFREDLFYRLAVVNLTLPPLRDRSEDVIPLVQHFIQKHAPGRSPRVERRALDRLLTHSWPGNVRQLENEVRRALVLGGEVLREEHFGLSQPKEGASKSDASSLNLRAQVDDLERKLIRRALDLARGNHTRAAELLGVSRFGLQKMMKRLGMRA
jgi:transcriptional regulator with GAF, ATPase, and Fis domain